jgi:translation initiation factor IF-2
MTISDKIRIYELSRDLNLENKDILDAAQKLSISVKSHSSSISTEEAKKITNLINKKNTDKKILSINKPSIKKDNHKQNKEDKSPIISSIKGDPIKDNSNKKPLLIKPLNKPESLKKISNQSIKPNKPNIINSPQSQANLKKQNIKTNPLQNINQDKKTSLISTTPPIKSPAKPPIQLIAKPKNINNNVKSNESSRKIYDSGNKRTLSNKPDKNTNKPKLKNNNRPNTPELVGAPIRREDSLKQNNKQNISFNQTPDNRSGSPNRPGMPNNRPGLRNKP